MREIKFRAWGKHPLENKDKYMQYNWQDDMRDMEDLWFNWGVYFELMQYTWLKDKNWKEIYEWDILETYAVLASNSTDSKPLYLKVYYNDWCFISNGLLNKFQADISTVVWNIYENPELLA